MTLNSESKYPTRRTYVLKMRGDARPGEFSGRLENVATGAQCEFVTGRELLESIARDIDACAAALAAEPKDRKP